MSLSFVEVPKTALRESWEFVRDGLERIIAKTSDDWIPEDVYSEIRAGSSALFLIYSAEDRVGFIVMQAWPSYHNGARLFVRALWVEPGALREHQQQIEDWLRDGARKFGATAIRMNSPRRWDAAGWTLKQYIYELPV